jgi:hypothetical protein
MICQRQHIFMPSFKLVLYSCRYILVYSYNITLALQVVWKLITIKIKQVWVTHALFYRNTNFV